MDPHTRKSFAMKPRVIDSISNLFLPACCLWISLTGCFHLVAQSAAVGDDRPHLGHQAGKMTEYGLPNDVSTAVPAEHVSPGPLVAPGIHLPSTGRLYALDNLAGKPELVHLKYGTVDINNHTGSNILKTQAAPFIYKPKKTLEIKGASAGVRLHQTSPVFFVRRSSWGSEESEAESHPASGPGSLSLVRLEVKSDRRVAATIAFTQVTGNASRSNAVVETLSEQIPGADWYKVTPKGALPPGEYGWMTLPNGQNTFGAVIYDFAIDAAAPENTGAMVADPTGF
jgi:hypothetical protein